MKSLDTHRTNLAQMTRSVLSWFSDLPRARRVWYGLLVVFVIQASVVALVTKFGVPPDETNHIHFIDYYTNNSLSPIFSDQQPTHNLGDKTREVDYVYHYAMSLVRRVLPFSTTAEHYIIRLFSIGFAVLTLVVLRRVFRKIGVSEWACVAALAVASCLSMVVLMSAVINNDVLVWLGVALGMTLVVRLYEKPRLLDLLWLASLVSYGGLVKRTLLPIGLVFAAVGLVLALRQWRKLLGELRKPTLAVVAAGLIMLGGVGLSAERVGGNVLQYGHISVTCDEVHGEAACYDFWWNIRERWLAQREPEPVVPPLEFAGRWVHESVINILDIQTQGWRHEVKPAAWVEPIVLSLFVAALGYGVIYETTRVRSDELSRYRLLLLGFGVLYVAFHLAVNYNEYQRSQVFGLALNGRYILAGLLPLLFLAAWYASLLLRRTPLGVRVGLVLGIVGMLAWQSGVYLLLQNPQLMHG